MSISVSLEELVMISGTEKLWPTEFAAMVKGLGNEDRVAWGAVSDWCRENHEEELAAAFGYIAKRESVSFELKESGFSYSKRQFVRFDGLPRLVQGYDFDTSSAENLAWAVALLAKRLRELREEIS